MHACGAQIRRLCLTLEQPCPEGEAFEVFMNSSEHVLARLARDIGARDVVEKNLDHAMQVRWLWLVLRI